MIYPTSSRSENGEVLPVVNFRDPTALGWLMRKPGRSVPCGLHYHLKTSILRCSCRLSCLPQAPPFLFVLPLAFFTQYHSFPASEDIWLVTPNPAQSLNFPERRLSKDATQLGVIMTGARVKFFQTSKKSGDGMLAVMPKFPPSTLLRCKIAQIVQV